VPHKIRIAFGFIFWVVAVVPVFVFIEALRGVKLGWQDAKELWKKARFR
jgi:hypothetical protein